MLFSHCPGPFRTCLLVAKTLQVGCAANCRRVFGTLLRLTIHHFATTLVPLQLEERRKYIARKAPKLRPSIVLVDAVETYAQEKANGRGELAAVGCLRMSYVPHKLKSYDEDHNAYTGY